MGNLTVSFFVPGPPRPERKINVRMGKFQRRVDTADSMHFKDRMRFYASQAYKGPPLTGALSCTIVCRKLKPKGYKKNQNHWKKKPDYDNFAKIIGDSLTGVIWIDDAQIFDGRVIKEFCSPGEDGISVTVTEKEGT
jgi:Holliday junction resolvase RusA-like endonuclease